MRRSSLAGLLLAIGAAAWSSGGCSSAPQVQPFAQSGEFAYTVSPSAKAPIASGRYSLDSLASGPDGLGWFPSFSLRYVSPASRLHPLLRPLLRAAPGDTSAVVVVVTFQDRSAMPRLPLERVAVGVDSVTAADGRALIDSMLGSLRNDRRVWYQHQVPWLEQHVDAVVSDSFELTQSVVARIPRNRIARLARWNEVSSVRPLIVRSMPPQPIVISPVFPPTSIQGAAKAMGLDAYASAGLMAGRIRLLDTGVDASHPWLVFSPRPVPILLNRGPALECFDCVTAPDCRGLDPADCDPQGHGTPSAAIFVARGSAPPESQGVTEAVVQSCRVWWWWAKANYMFYSADAIEDALKGGFAWPAGVAVVEVVDSDGPDGWIAQTADGAYFGGVAVVAPIGNGKQWDGTDPTTGSQSPGSARGVLGIGAREAATPAADYVDQSYGHVPYRSKPDLQTLTGTVSAARGTGVMTLPSTSGAAPYAAAAALAMRNLLAVAASTVDPGQVYSALLACGEEVRATGGAFPDLRGAGLIHLPDAGRCWFGPARLHTWGHKDIGIDVADPGARTIRVGLWWKDPGPLTLPFGWWLQLHNDFDLELINPGGRTVAKSAGSFGVFERMTYSAPNNATSLLGHWTVRVQATSVGFPWAKAFWTVFVTP